MAGVGNFRPNQFPPVNLRPTLPNNSTPPDAFPSGGRVPPGAYGVEGEPLPGQTEEQEALRQGAHALDTIGLLLELIRFTATDVGAILLDPCMVGSSACQASCGSM